LRRPSPTSSKHGSKTCASPDHWRDLALDAGDIALDAERAAADVALTLSKEIRSYG
jgi:hypothetical protein